MADILQRYGIKEVADVTFYHINKTTNEPDYPVLVLDSLKVTSIEQTAETTEARGGKGNAKLIVWDFGKEITVNIEDALFSPKSLSIMFSDSRVLEDTDATEKGYIKKSARVVATNDGATPTLKLDGKQIEVTLQELLALIPRTRKRSNAYRGLSSKLELLGVKLNITTNRTKQER